MYICICVYIYMYICIYVYMYMCVCIWIYVPGGLATHKQVLLRANQPIQFGHVWVQLHATPPRSHHFISASLNNRFVQAQSRGNSGTNVSWTLMIAASSLQTPSSQHCCMQSWSSKWTARGDYNSLVRFSMLFVALIWEYDRSFAFFLHRFWVKQYCTWTVFWILCAGPSFAANPK